MKIGVISLFPEAFHYLKDKKASGLMGKAFESSLFELHIEDLRQYGEGRHQTVDDTPYGGGDGMVLKAEPIRLAREALLSKMELKSHQVKTVFLSPSGQLWTQKQAEAWTAGKPEDLNFIFLCGRYGGVDQRAVEVLFDEVVSIGPYVLNGGELATLCLVESLVRLIPGGLGNPESFAKDSFSSGQKHLIEAPSYTKPRLWRDREVPEVLLSGDHKRIQDHKDFQSKNLSASWRKQAREQLEDL